MIKFIDDNIDGYINGKKLYGNDFPIEKIAEWYCDEAGVHQEIVPKEHLDNFDEYEVMTKLFLYDFLPENRFWWR